MLGRLKHLKRGRGNMSIWVCIFMWIYFQEVLQILKINILKSDSAWFTLIMQTKHFCMDGASITSLPEPTVYPRRSACSKL